VAHGARNFDAWAAPSGSTLHHGRLPAFIDGIRSSGSDQRPLHADAAFRIRVVQDEALAALAMCKRDPALRAMQADRYDNAKRVLTQTFVKTLGDAWNRGRDRGNIHRQFARESVVEWWLDHASHPDATDDRHVAAASFG